MRVGDVARDAYFQEFIKQGDRFGRRVVDLSEAQIFAAGWKAHEHFICGPHDVIEPAAGPADAETTAGR